MKFRRNTPAPVMRDTDPGPATEVTEEAAAWREEAAAALMDVMRDHSRQEVPTSEVLSTYLSLRGV